MTGMKYQWEDGGSLAGNVVLHGDGFTISYAKGANLSMVSFFASDGTADETALIVPRTGKDGDDFFILNGDFRQEYEVLAPKGLTACLEFYRQHKSHHSSWSDPYEETP